MSRPKVLIIEDHKDSLEMLILMLSNEFECTGVESRDEALRLLSADYNPACILSDYSMPGIPFDKFMKQLSNKIKVVMVSAHSDAEAQAQKYGIKRILAKPADPRRLIAAIRQAIQSGEHPIV